MDIKTMDPEAYAKALLEQGVPANELQERMIHDMLVAVAAQLSEVGVPEGFEDFAADLNKCLMDNGPLIRAK